MKRLIFFLFAMAVMACSNDEDRTFPNLRSSMADMLTDEKGKFTHFITDEGEKYDITNTLTNNAPNAVYRVVAGYEVQADGRATLYSLDPVWRLRDSTVFMRHDPVNVMAVWRGGKYINMQLSSYTQGGTQYWGFVTDSVTERHHHLSLHHNQNNDKRAYSGTLYASLPLDSIKTAVSGDTISLTIVTYNLEKKKYKFVY